MQSIDNVRSSLKNGELDDKLLYLYNNVEEQKERYLAALDGYTEFFENSNVEIFSAPGRTEVSGNHTDHQYGRVMAASVNLDIIAIVSSNDSGIIRIKSHGYNMDTVDITMLDPIESENNKAISIIRGIVSRFKSLGFNIGGFDAYTTSNVLKGSGLSSSAAFEVMIGTVLSHIYNDGGISPVDIAKVGQYAENVFFGKPSGLMDQMACSVGGFITIDFADKENPAIDKLEFDFNNSGHCLCIVDTGGSHADLTDDYAAIPTEMKNVAGFFGCNVLREVDEKKFFDNIGEIRKTCGDRAVLRAMHFFAENRRVERQASLLNLNDFAGFKKLVIESGRSSYMYNQNTFSTKDVASQGISVAIAISENWLNNRGAYRVHGGGFAGTIQAFVPNEIVDDYKDVIEKAFGEGSCYILKVRPVGGIRVI